MSSTKNFWQDVLQQGFRHLAEDLSLDQVKELFQNYSTHNYKPLPVNLVKGDGIRVWDEKGNEYLDFIGTYSATAHGHLNPTVVKALKDQLDEVAVVSRAFYNAEVGLFCRALADYSSLDMVCPMNSGAEANETCIKLARKWAYTIKGVPEDQAEIIVFQDNFHGRTTTIVGFSTEEAYKAHFGPFTPGFKVVPYGDIDAVRRAITPNTAAILGEPIQAEGGIIIPPDGFMADLRKVCTENNVLLIWDEVQTGFCRTGKRFAWQYEDAKPDLLAVGKPLGGGLLPVSAAVGRREVMEVFQPGDHGSTFGGNPLAAAVAVTALAVMEQDDFAGNSTKMGDLMMSQLRDLPFDQIIEVRGRGLLIGFEIDDTVDTSKLSVNLTKNGILTKETRHRTFRLTPPLTITEEIVSDAVVRIRKAFEATLSS
ncbi:MAG: ornithine--oxo-acid transaminase [Armatimonadetes bacterium]|nr:ornithine--oxo-acid transaminase [Armatimonadota bacterium]